MKKLYNILILSILVFSLQAQLLDPVHWTTEVKSLGDNTYQLYFKATLVQGWAIYSQSSDPNAAAPTEISFAKDANISLIGKPEELGKKKEGPEPLFDNLIVSKYYDHVDFVQKIKVKDPNKPVQAEVYYMTCNSEKCIPPTPKPITFYLSEGTKTTGDAGTSDHSIATASTSSTPTEINSSSSTKDSKLLDPVKVKCEMSKSAAGNPVLTFTATMDEGWHIYSNKIADGGPIPSSVDFEQGSHFTLKGELQEKSEHKISAYDEIFEMDLVKYKEQVQFIQEIEVKDPNTLVKGSFTYQTCDAKQCLPPVTLGFSYDPKTEKLIFEGANKGTGMAPPIDFNGDIVDQSNPNLINGLENPKGNCGEELIKGTSNWWTFIFGFIGGLLAILTPCVFPMIPLTVSFFTKDSKQKGIRNAIIYGIFIIIIYVSIGLLVTSIFGATALNELSTNWIANFIFFIIFIVFAFSFFGYFEITLPSSWTTKSDALSESGGLIGIFFMAFTLALVSFSCTGPIVGSALVQSATSKLGPFLVMLGFSMALAIPFGLFAAFPAWLNSLPKSGSWMTNVKVVLGFLELALALKFLSNTDMARKWNILPYEVFMALWVVIFALMTAYLFGLFKFPHDSPVKKLSKPRMVFALAALGMTFYLASGFIYQKDVNSYRSLNLMSGIAPPSTYNLFLPKAQINETLKSKYISFTKCANNLDCFKDYYEGLTYAKEVNKPILLDYTGIFCQNCRRTEDRIWVADRVRNTIANDYVLVSLYCDDPKQLDKQILSKPRNIVLKTVGNKWADHQILNFEQNSQPLYVLLTPQEEILAKPRGYRDGIDSYYDFLQCGLNAFKKI